MTKYFDKEQLPKWDGEKPEQTWITYRRELKQWLMTTDIPEHKQGMLLNRALTGRVKDVDSALQRRRLV